MKKLNRSTKFGLSIGGWTLSNTFSGIANSDATRRTFANSAVKLTMDLGLDFIDLDWEYPGEGGNDQSPVPHSPDDIQNYVALLQAVRDIQDRPIQGRAECRVPRGPQQLPPLGLQVHLRFVGPYQHHDGLKYSAHSAVQDYAKGGCPSDKIVLGIPIYGRSFEGTTVLYGNFTQPTAGSWVYMGDGKGVWDYKSLPQSGATEYYDDKLVATYSYDAAAKTLISYEGPKSLAAKLEYIQKYNLGARCSGRGCRRPRWFGALVDHAILMLFSQNNINYPNSPYENIRNTTGPRPLPPPRPPRRPPSPPYDPLARWPHHDPAPTTAPAPVATAPADDKCEGNTKTCFWPLTHQKLDYNEATCKSFGNVFVWCS
ncbi:Aste57867_18444 [Aphanomyces stellatus]|uniref:Aste57867_18444 protein n=1 Tax=Aphanomyces stellatus TaxID=120398 RepID=A0A485LBW2_9STRA|nr:hypothetical protein As57867_018382 [Aphanomyces stellatus]VFT95180.1 Aste57867_18444 [Aphanomyces stellatus]